MFGVRGTRLDRIPKDGLARLAMRLQHRLARRARLIVANSDAAADELRARGYPSERVRVVPNGVEAERFAREPSSRARWRAELGVADDEQLIGTVARMDRQKDPQTFIEAIARAARPRRRFVWVGDGPRAVRGGGTRTLARRRAAAPGRGARRAAAATRRWTSSRSPRGGARGSAMPSPRHSPPDSRASSRTPATMRAPGRWRPLSRRATPPRLPRRGSRRRQGRGRAGCASTWASLRWSRAPEALLLEAARGR